MDFRAIDANADLVVAMQEMGVGVDEILQYARGVFDRDEIRSLLYGLEQLAGVPHAEAVER